MAYGSSPYVQQKLIGITGPTGSTGPIGSIGNQGPRGNTGNTGNTGIGVASMTLENDQIKTIFTNSSLPHYAPKFRGAQGNYYIAADGANLISSNGVTIFSGSTFYTETSLYREIFLRGLTTSSQNENLKFIEFTTNENTIGITYNLTGLPYLGISGGSTGQIVYHASGNYFYGLTGLNYDVSKTTVDGQVVNYGERVQFVRPIRKILSGTTTCYFHWPIDWEKANTFVLEPIVDQISGLVPIAQVVLLRNAPSADFAKGISIIVPPSVTGGILTKFATTRTNNLSGFTLENASYAVSWPLSYAPCFTENMDVINMISLDDIWYANYGIYENITNQVDWNVEYNNCPGSLNVEDPPVTGYCCQPCDVELEEEECPGEFKEVFNLFPSTDIECNKLGSNYIFFYTEADANAGCCGANSALGICCYRLLDGSFVKEINVRPCDCQRFAAGNWHQFTAYSDTIKNGDAINCSNLYNGVGPCCDGNGACVETTKNLCESQNNYWQGVGKVCQYNYGTETISLCSSGTGGCCVSESLTASCSQKSFTNCGASGGRFYGRGISCGNETQNGYPACIAQDTLVLCCQQTTCGEILGSQCVGGNSPVTSCENCLSTNPIVNCCSEGNCTQKPRSQCSGQEVSSCFSCTETTETCLDDNGQFKFITDNNETILLNPGDYFAGGVVVGLFNPNNSSCFGNTAFGGLPDWYTNLSSPTDVDKQKLFQFMNSGQEKKCDSYNTTRDLLGYGFGPINNDSWLLIVSPINVRMEMLAAKSFNGDTSLNSWPNSTLYPFFKTKMHLGTNSNNTPDGGIDFLGEGTNTGESCETCAYDDLPAVMDGSAMEYTVRHTQTFVWSHGGTAYSDVLDANFDGAFITSNYSGSCSLVGKHFKNEGFYGTLSQVRNGIAGTTYWGNDNTFDGCLDVPNICSNCTLNPYARATALGEPYALTRSTGWWSRNWGIYNSCRLFASDLVEYYRQWNNTVASNFNIGGAAFANYRNFYGASGSTGTFTDFINGPTLGQALSTATFQPWFFHGGSANAKTTIAEAASVANRHYYPEEYLKEKKYSKVSRWYVPSADELGFIARACLDPIVNLQRKIKDWRYPEDESVGSGGVPIGSTNIGANGWVWTSTGSFDEGITKQFIQATGGAPISNNNNVYGDNPIEITCSKFTKAWAMKFAEFNDSIPYDNTKDNFRVKKADDHSDRYEVRLVRLVRCDGKSFPSRAQDPTYNIRDEELANLVWNVPRLTDAAMVNGTSPIRINNATSYPIFNRWNKYLTRLLFQQDIQSSSIYDSTIALPTPPNPRP